LIVVVSLGATLICFVVSGVGFGTGVGAASFTGAVSLVTTDFFSAQPVKIIKLNINTTTPVNVSLFFMMIPLFPYEKNC
jgi:hypothetical protein